MEGMLIMSTHCRIIERRWILIYQFRLGMQWGENIYLPLFIWLRELPGYNEEVKLVYDKFLGLVNRMDFTSQEKIYYQWALKEKDKQEWDSAASFLLKAMELYHYC